MFFLKGLYDSHTYILSPLAVCVTLQIHDLLALNHKKGGVSKNSDCLKYGLTGGCWVCTPRRQNKALSSCRDAK